MNKVVVVTGASRGIGKAIALKYAKEGYHVAINYRGSEQKALEVQAMCEAFGIKAKAYQGDVSQADQMDAMFRSIIEDFGRIDVLVNNSGITKDQLFLRMNAESFMDVINVNLLGTFNCTKAVSKIMFKQKEGCIINMASVVGITGNIGQANYAASKAGIIGLTKSLAKEFASRHIRVNAIAPGFIESDMTDVLSDQVKENIMKNIPLNALGKVEDVANVAYFLGNDDARYITGQVIHVDGGMVM